MDSPLDKSETTPLSSLAPCLALDHRYRGDQLALVLDSAKSPSEICPEGSENAPSCSQQKIGPHGGENSTDSFYRRRPD